MHVAIGLIPGAIAAISASLVLAQSPHPSKPPVPREVHIVIEHNRYGDGNPVTIHVGDSVVWENHDLMPHTASSSDGEPQDFDTGFIPPGAQSEPIVFLKESGSGGFGYGCDVHDGQPLMKGRLIVEGLTAPAPNHHHENPNIHSFLVLGQDAGDIFLHHYDLFNNPDHQYHATVEAEIADQAAKKVYNNWRSMHGDGAEVVVDTQRALLPEILSSMTFVGIISSRVEREKDLPWDTQWGNIIPGLKDIAIKIKRIIQLRHFDANARFPDRLMYQLFGNGSEVFLAHEVTAAPSFQHVVKLDDLLPSFLTPAVIQQAPFVTIIDKQMREAGTYVVKGSVLSNSTHMLLSPPYGTLNPTPPLKDGEVLNVHIGNDLTLRSLKVKKSIWSDFRILNR